MQNFRNILFVSQGMTDETDALKQALSIARNNKAALSVLLVCPELSKEVAEYEKEYETSLIEKLQSKLLQTREAVKVSETDVPVKIEIESGSAPAVRIIRHVLSNNYDLVIKEAESNEGNKGFKALDMELLRQCPCPVWLCRPIKRHRNEIRVAVAIDPASEGKEARELSKRLLQLSRSVADTCSGELTVISCWDDVFEEYINNYLHETPEEKLRRIFQEAESSHSDSLNDLIQQSKISGKKTVHHVRGRPHAIIPKYIEDKGIDILVMGTVARTGISGFVIGNTAENIMQKLECSLLALKPNGFVSPVKV